ncbi:MAG TPA: glycosyltransferase [Chloroflexia bacterium]|nr:glycosyltransferase [Chloroflexia bacterium]
MRVLFLNPQGYVEKQPPLGMTDTGGQTVYILELARALSAQGVKVDIVTRQFDGRKPIEDLTTNARIVRIPCGPDTFVVKEKLYDLMPEFVRRIHRYVKNEDLQYDVIHSHYWDGGYAGLLLARRLGIPHIFTPHSLGKWKEVDMAVDAVTSRDLNALYGYQRRIATEKRIMRSADIVLMLSQIQRIKLMQHYSVEFEKIRVLYPGVDTRTFCPAYDATPLEPLPTTNNMLLVSRFVPAKGIDSAIDVFSRVARKIDSHLYIVTTNKLDSASAEERENERTVQAMIKSYSLQDRVTFLGFISDRKILASWYRRADIFLLPSRYEPFGLTAMEAMASGTVTLISHMAGSRELILNGVNGFTVNMHERISVANLIVRLFKDAALSQRIGENEVLSVQQHFSWEMTAKKLVRHVYLVTTGALPPSPAALEWELE